MIIFKPGAVPKSRPPYPMSPVELQELQRQLDMLLLKGLIEPASSPYGSPVLFVKRVDDKKSQIVCGFRDVNKLSISHRIYIPCINDSLSMLHGSNFLTTLDLQSGFHQQHLTEFDSKKRQSTFDMANSNGKLYRLVYVIVGLNLKRFRIIFSRSI